MWPLHRCHDGLSGWRSRCSYAQAAWRAKARGRSACTFFVTIEGLSADSMTCRACTKGHLSGLCGLWVDRYYTRALQSLTSRLAVASIIYNPDLTVLPDRLRNAHCNAPSVSCGTAVYGFSTAPTATRWSRVSDARSRGRTRNKRRRRGTARLDASPCAQTQISRRSLAAYRTQCQSLSALIRTMAPTSDTRPHVSP